MADDSGWVIDDLTGIDFVRMMTAYLEGEMDNDERRQMDRHLEGCQGYRAAIDQFETVIRLAGRLTVAGVANLYS